MWRLRNGNDVRNDRGDARRLLLVAGVIASAWIPPQSPITAAVTLYLPFVLLGIVVMRLFTDWGLRARVELLMCAVAIAAIGPLVTQAAIERDWTFDDEFDLVVVGVLIQVLYATFAALGTLLAVTRHRAS